MINFRPSLFIIAVSSLGLFSCNKEDNPADYETSQITLYLTDAPGSYDALKIDLQLITLKIAGKSEIKLTPNIVGQYDLLQFHNGKDTLILDVTVPVGTLEEIKLGYGGNNSVTIRGVKYPLTTPTEQEGIVKLEFGDEDIQANLTYKVWLDMDAGKSVTKIGTNAYKLTPSVRAYSSATNGRIVGYVLPEKAYSTIYAIKGTDTSVAIPNDTTGYFMVSGLEAGSYTFIAAPDTTGFQPYTATVNVNKGNITNAGNITLHP
jgi:hypothetical protein